MDSLLAIVQMPAGIPVATVAIGKPGATTPESRGTNSWRGGRVDREKLDAYKEKLAKGVEKSQETQGGRSEVRRADPHFVRDDKPRKGITASKEASQYQ